MLWSAMPTSPPAPLSPPPISTRRCWTLSDFPSPNTPWHRCATISPNCAPKVCSKNCPTLVATVSPTRAIPSACSSSSYSSASMLHSPPVSSSPSPAIATSPRTNVVNLTASINGSPTISTLSYPLSASKPLLNQYNENKILVSRCISTKTAPPSILDGVSPCAPSGNGLWGDQLRSPPI